MYKERRIAVLGLDELVIPCNGRSGVVAACTPRAERAAASSTSVPTCVSTIHKFWVNAGQNHGFTHCRELADVARGNDALRIIGT